MMFQEMPKNILISTRNKYSSQSSNKSNNNLEVPEMQFTEKEGKIKMNRINNLDFKSLFEPNNNILLQKIIDNLISSKIYKSDYDDELKYSLLKSLQNILEYLLAKKNKIQNINQQLNSNIKNIMKNTDLLEQ